MRIEKLLITPEIAKGFLDKNTSNRKVKNPVVLRYSQDMASGKWKPNTGELIKCTADGDIIDGQHRLMAVVLSKTPIEFHIGYDMDRNVFDVLDTGSCRTANDIFYIEGIKSATAMPSIIQLYNTLISGHAINQRVINKNDRLTNARLLEEYNSNPIFWAMIGRKAYSLYQSFGKVISPQLIGGMYAYFYSLSPEDADKFMTELCTGQDLTNNTTALLRTKLISDRLSSKKMTGNLKNGLIIKTWNYFRQGLEAKILKYDIDRETTPKAI